jgi:hypothetical protein
MNDLPLGCSIPIIILAISAIPAWFTHVIYCILNEQWLFLIAGAIMAPIGVIHGWGLWFGFF